jgi:hypothetical protein
VVDFCGLPRSKDWCCTRLTKRALPPVPTIETAGDCSTPNGPDAPFLNADQNYLIDERTLNQSETYTLPVVASGRGPLVVTICWNDPAGTATSALNDRTPRLVNDLDVRVSDGNTTVQPWVLDPENPNSPASRGDNIVTT